MRSLRDTDLTPLAFDAQQIPDLLELLFGTHAFYSDRESRASVQKCLVGVILYSLDPKTLGPLVKALRQEAQKPSIARSSSFVLVEWCSILMQNLAGTPLWDDFGSDIILADVDALEKCLYSTSRPSLSRSAIVVTRRGFRKLFAPAETRQKNLTRAVEVLTTKAGSSTAKNAPLLGVIAGVSSRQPALKPLLNGLKTKYYEFYIREIVGSRTPIPPHVASGLDDFFSVFATLQDMETDIFPTIEKGLLRAPEVVLEGVLAPIVHALPDDFDLSKILENKLLKPLLSSVKSSNAAVRNGALVAFRAIAQQCHEKESIDKITIEIASPLGSGKLASADQRVLHAEMLDAVSLSQQGVDKVATTLATVVAKEGNEAALAAETSTLARAITLTLRGSGTVSKPVLDTVVKGLTDKKPAFRKIWLLRVGGIIQSFGSAPPSAGVSAFAEAVIPKLVDNFNEVIANAATAAQSGIIVGAYILTALAPALQTQFADSPVSSALAKASISKQSLTLTQKQHFLFSQRVYNKLTVEEDVRWLCLALSSVAQKLDAKTDQDVVHAWAEAIIYVITASGIHAKVQQDMSKALSDLYVQRPALISGFILEGLWNVVAQDDTKEKDSKTDGGKLINVLRSICLGPTELARQEDSPVVGELESQACSMLVIARPELIQRSSWIDMCLRMGLDPGNLARKNVDRLLKEIGIRTSSGQQVRSRNL